MRWLLCRLGVHPHRELLREVQADPEGEWFLHVFVWSCRHCPAEWLA